MSKRSDNDGKTILGIGKIKHVNDWLEKKRYKNQKVDVYENKDGFITYFKIQLDKKEFADALNVDKVFITIKLKDNKSK